MTNNQNHQVNKNEDKNENDNEKFLQLLDAQYTWPDYYMFRFVVQAAGEVDFMHLLSKLVEAEKISVTPSKTGKFKSISFRVLIHKSQEVVEVYHHFQGIPGTIRI
ncbi:MAG: DUF493 family protein [Bacteriovoracaceae bacterium]|nr:DUF493 family protein [Bacteriovoracaceae bacterium]